MKEDEINKVREKRKRQLRRQAQIDKVKGYLMWIVAAILWMGVAVTFVGGCVGTFFKSADEPQEDYEEYIHSTIP